MKRFSGLNKKSRHLEQFEIRFEEQYDKENNLSRQ